MCSVESLLCRYEYMGTLEKSLVVQRELAEPACRGGLTWGACILEILDSGLPQIAGFETGWIQSRKTVWTQTLNLKP